METLRDKIEALQNKLAENLTEIDAIKAKADEDTKAKKEENKKLLKIIKKLEDTEATIAGIYGEVEPDAPVLAAVDAE